MRRSEPSTAKRQGDVLAMRQGDVLLVPVSRDRVRGRPIAPVNGRFILAEGEQTGHHHSVKADPHVEFIGDGIEAFLTVQDRPSRLTHQEHTAHSLSPSDYEVVQQRHVMPGSEQRVLRVTD